MGWVCKQTLETVQILTVFLRAYGCINQLMVAQWEMSIDWVYSKVHLEVQTMVPNKQVNIWTLIKSEDQ